MRIERFAGTLDRFGQAIVQRGQNVAPLGMMAGGELLGFLNVTPAAVAGRDNRGNHRPVMIEGIDVLLFSL